jgi:hypothetical protein
MISPCIGIVEFGVLLPGAQERDEIPALIVRRTALCGIDTANALFFPARTGDCARDLESPIWKFGDVWQVRRESGGNNQQPGDKCFLHVFLPCANCSRRNATVPQPISSVPQYQESAPVHRWTEVLQFEQLTHFNFGLRFFARAIRETFGPLERLFPRPHLDHVAGDEFLRLGERPVDHGALSSGVLDAPVLRGWL